MQMTNNYGFKILFDEVFFYLLMLYSIMLNKIFKNTNNNFVIIEQIITFSSEPNFPR